MALKILITGASVAGNALARWLARDDAEVTVVERATAFRDGGQNVDVRGVGREVLRKMGLEEAALALGTGEKGTAWIDKDDRIAGWERATLSDHAGDPRPDIETMDNMLRGETRDETWNACQRQFLIDGWMHNNLRMYWGKRIIAMTPSPEAAWATACFLNDRLSLDGRDPSTYGNIAAMFAGSPSDRERPIY